MHLGLESHQEEKTNKRLNPQSTVLLTSVTPQQQHRYQCFETAGLVKAVHSSADISDDNLFPVQFVSHSYGDSLWNNLHNAV